MVPRGNLSRFISSNNLVAIEGQTIFGLSRNARYCEREGLALQMADLTCQGTNRERAIERRRSQAQRRSHGQHDWNEGDKTQRTEAEFGAQRDTNADCQHSGKRK